jgi:hypothetical protein
MVVPLEQEALEVVGDWVTETGSGVSNLLWCISKTKWQTEWEDDNASLAFMFSSDQKQGT